MDNVPLQPWTQQPGERAEAFEAFRIYRDAGSDRSTARVAQQCGKQKTQMDRWCSRWGWVRRAAAYDRHLDPGSDVEASRWLANERPISGFGVEMVGIDAGAAGGFDPPFPLHNFLLGAGRLGLTQLANLDRLPITGALIVVSPLKVVGGTGSPSRVVAFVPKG